MVLSAHHVNEAYSHAGAIQKEVPFAFPIQQFNVDDKHPGAASSMLLQVLRDLELVLDLTLAPLKRCASIEDHVGSVLDDHIHASILTSLLMTAVRLPPLKAYVRQLHDLAFSSDRRPVVLLGAGGEGKSVLMAMLCEELVQQRPLVRLSLELYWALIGS